VSRPSPLPFFLIALALFANGVLLRADDPPAPTPPPGYKAVYQGDNKTPIFVKNMPDVGQSSAVRRMEIDPLDHQRVFSETNPMAHQTFVAPIVSGLNQNANAKDQFVTKVYDTTENTSVYNVGSKTTFHTSGYDGVKTAPGYDQASSFTKTANLGQDQNALNAFAAMGSNEKDRSAPVNAAAYQVNASPDADKTFDGTEADAVHRKVTRLSNGQLLLDDIPERALSIDEVKNLINHGFKPDTTQAPAPASKPLNDPNYQPTPLRISPADAENDQSAPATSKPKVQDDDANDPVPSPGTMADPPENNEPLPKK
jgi:hypothetical protein